MAEANEVKLVYHVAVLPRRQPRQRLVQPGGQRRVLRLGRREVPGVPPDHLRRTSRRRRATGYTDAQLKQLRRDRRHHRRRRSTTWQKCYDAGKYNEYVESVQTQSAKDGVNGTPTVKLDGQAVELGPDAADVRRAGQGRHQVTSGDPEPHSIAVLATSAPCPSGSTRCASSPASSSPSGSPAAASSTARRRAAGRPSTSRRGPCRFGIVGGRLYHVITHPAARTAARAATRSGRSTIWEGGLGIWGAVALGALGAWIGCRRHGVRVPGLRGRGRARRRGRPGHRPLGQLVQQRALRRPDRRCPGG